MINKVVLSNLNTKEPPNPQMKAGGGFVAIGMGAAWQ